MLKLRFGKPNARIIRLSKEGGWVVLGQAAAVVGSLFLVRILTEMLEPVEYGQLALGLTVAGLLNQVVLGGVTNGVVRYYSIASEQQQLAPYMRASAQLLSYATAAVLAIGFVLVVALHLAGYGRWTWLVVAAVILSLVNGYNSTLNGVQNAARQRSLVAFHRALESWLRVVIVIGVLLWLNRSSAAVILSYAIASLLVLGSQLVFARRIIPATTGSSASAPKWARDIWVFSWPFSAWGVFTWLQQVSDRWALEMFSTTDEVGMYAVLFQLGYTPIAMLTGLSITFLAPILYQRSGSATVTSRLVKTHQIALKVTGLGLLATLVSFLALLPLHEMVFQLLVATEYRAVSYLLPWVVLAGGVFASGQILSLKLQSELRSAEMIRAKVFTAVLGVTFNLYGASVAGMEGVVYAILAFSLVYLAWMIRLGYRIPVQE